MQRAIAKFVEATETFDEATRRELMNEILAYNQKDLAPWAVFEWLRSKDTYAEQVPEAGICEPSWCFRRFDSTRPPGRGLSYMARSSTL
jgi:hypothetical protein